MRKSASALWSTSLACLVAVTPIVHAQPSGLRLQGNAEGFALREADNGLHLRFSSTKSLNDVASTAPDFTKSNIARNTMRADWPVFGYGLRTSLGLSWNTSETNAPYLARAPLEASTFLGFGWRGEPFRNSAWKVSAELGTRLSAGSVCSSITSICPTLQPLGLSGDAVGNGLRLNPYISFGATLNY